MAQTPKKMDLELDVHSSVGIVRPGNWWIKNLSSGKWFIIAPAEPDEWPVKAA